MNRENVYACLFLAVHISAAVLTAGCRDADNASEETGERGTVKLPMSASGQSNIVAKCCDDAFRRLTATPREECAASALVDYFQRIEFDERSYASRAAAISDYYQIVSAVSDGLLSKCENQDTIWRFKLDAIDRVNLEILRCEREPEGGVYGQAQLGVSMFMTQRQYLESLKARRFDFIRRGFEYGPFTLYFKSLPSAAKGEWLSRLERVAHRKVVIWDPDNQFMDMPTYVPECSRGNDAGGAKGQNSFVEQIGDEKVIFHRTSGNTTTPRPLGK